MLTAKNRVWVLLTAALTLLLIPFFAMQITSEVQWTASDFIIAGFLLGGIALLCEACLRIFKKKSQRIIALCVVLVFGFLIWAELAVGIFGSPIAGS